MMPIISGFNPTQYTLGRGTLSIVMADGTRIEMNADNVTISDMTERLEHRSISGRYESAIINQEFTIEATGPGLEFIMGENAPTTFGVPASPPARVERLPASEELAKQNLIRVIRMDRRRE